MLLLCVVAFSGRAQAEQGSIDAAKRIEQMRDQAAVGGVAVEAIGDAEPSADALAAESASEAEKPLPANELLPLGTGQGDLFGADAEQSGTGAMNDGWLMSTLIALGVVLAIVFGIRYLLKRGGVVSTAVPQGSVVEVLSRTTVAPRSHVLLMRVGTRILVVSDSSAGMRTLASLDDPAEVADLLGTIDSAKPTSMTQSFGSVMKRLSGQWSGEDEDLDRAGELSEAGPELKVDPATGALSRVRSRLAAMSDTGGRT